MLSQPPIPLCSIKPGPRPKVEGKFFSVSGQKFLVQGVSYGPFAPVKSREYGDPGRAAADLALMKANGVNCIRTYTTPPDWFLDLCYENGLFVLLGLSWEQHVAFLDDTRLERRIRDGVRQGVRRSAGHPAVFGYCLGNEIPSSIVRWHGARKVERFLRRLYVSGKCEDSAALFTYVNYPTTEYLELPFLDFASFNVYLETESELRSYLSRLQNLCADLPLVITELGLDALRHGEEAQAAMLERQLEAVFSEGCAGGVVFSWTDEWYRGGSCVTDWAFGLTTRERQPRESLKIVASVFSRAPFANDGVWPGVSVVVCVRNGEATIRECLERTLLLSYPDLEVIVVDDGSDDATREIVGELGIRFHFIYKRVDSIGLGAARNHGLKMAGGEIVAFLDSDAYPEKDWLHYLVKELIESGSVAAGGPNMPPNGVGLVPRSVASAPGWPRAVLLSDREAEHIPGCNMAFLKSRLEEIGGFDAQFVTAGDDVDVCWRLREKGWRIGYHPAALVWHYPRTTISGYWKQQRGYGRAEVLLERKWPQNYDELGQVCWRGVIYGGPVPQPRGFQRIYYGVWGSSLFQSIYQFPAGRLAEWQGLWTTPEWNIIAVLFCLLSLLGVLWKPLLLALPLFLVALALPLAQALRASFRSLQAEADRPLRSRLASLIVTSFLHLTQPLARLTGRLGRGMRALQRGELRLALPVKRAVVLWQEKWEPPAKILARIQEDLVRRKVPVSQGGAFDEWDLEIQPGVTGSLRVLMAQEEHPQGKQLVRLRSWPRWPPQVVLVVVLFALLCGLAAWDGNWLVSLSLGAAVLLMVGRALFDAAVAAGVWQNTTMSNPHG